MTLLPIESEALRNADHRRMLAEDDWSSFVMRLAIDLMDMVRPRRFARHPATMKLDRSPVTRLEILLEKRARTELSYFAPDATFIGEESEGHLPETGVALSIDPIDGTWAFLSGTAAFATTLAAFEDGQVIAAAVANPSNMEVAYAGGVGTARLLQRVPTGDGAIGVSLPLDASAGPVLVNVQPHGSALQVVAALHEQWNVDALSMVRSTGGSPAWNIVETALGFYTYVHTNWSIPSASWDLAAAIHILRCAGGDVVDLAGTPIELTGHVGPFVAGLFPEHRNQVIEAVRESLSG